MKIKASVLIKIAASTLVVLLFLAPLAVAFAFELAWRGRIYPGVKAGGISLAGLTPSEGKQLLEEKISQLPKRLLLREGDRSWPLELEAVALRYQPEKTAQKAFVLGRNWDNPLLALREKRELLRRGKDLPLDFHLDEEKLDQFIATLSAQIDQKSVPASLILKEGKIKIEKGKVGRRVQRKGLKNLIREAVAGADFRRPLLIPVAQVGSPPSEKQIAATRQRAKKLIAKSIVVTDTNINLVLEDKQLISFLDFNGGFKEEDLHNWLKAIKNSVDKPAENALFKFENGRVTAFSPAKTGYALDQEKTARLLKEKLSLLLKGEKKTAVLELAGKIIQPKIRTENSNRFGISGLVGKGESWFFHSIPSRITNIDLASNKFDGVLIEPGEEFSFNKILGDISAETGYKPAWVIKQGKTVLGDGGGVCQVSTTMFRAALNAGLPITERHAHSYRVSYYEYNSLLGMDATVFAPSVDLKFKNDYPCYLLIQREINIPRRYLAFYLYGCPDGRKVTISNHKVWGVVPPPPPLYVDDPSLPPGKTKQIDFPAWGSKTSFDWQVTRNGKTLYQKTFYSNFRPWQAVYLRGPSLPPQR